MKTQLNFAALALLFSMIGTPLSPCFAQGTAFTYQGRLNDGANPASGKYDLRFAIYDNASTGTQQGNSLTNTGIGVTNGLFTATLDFGNQFPGANRWLEIGVRTNGAASFFTLSPRQALTPAPYAITAGSVVSGGLAAGTYGNAVTLNNAANSVSGTFTGSGVNLTGVNAATLGGLTTDSFWKIGGNTGANPTNGAYLGTVDNLPLEFKVNGARALRLEYGVVPNVIGGYSGNMVSNGVVGALIGGGGDSGYYLNRVGGSYASVLGGYGNRASGYGSTAIGAYNAAFGINATAMGLGNLATGNISMALGDSTTASGYGATTLGDSTTASGGDSTAMGYQTSAVGDYATALGAYTSASSTNSVAMGYGTEASGDTSTAMGYNSIASGQYSTAMGQSCTAGGLDAVAAGQSCSANGINSIALGEACSATALATTALGYHTTASSPGATALGVFSQALHNNTFVWSDGTPNPAFASSAANQFLIYASGGVGINTADPLGDALCVSGDARIDAQPTAWNEGLAINCPTSMTANGGFGGIHFHSTGQGQGFSSSSIKWSEMYNYAPEIGNAVGGGLAFIRNNSSTALYLSSSGNVGVGTTAPAHLLQVGNAYCDGNTWSPASDRNLKAGFQPVDAEAVLAKVAVLPITSWHYTNDQATPHIGPMAQDFYAAFNIGADDKHITTTDESGVALAAIQGLNQKLEATRAENAELKQQLAELKQLVQALLPRK